MKTEPSNHILDRVNRRTDLRVPEGYFEDFAKRMESALPEQPWEKPSADPALSKRTLWQQVRTYVYMAAMFAGVWCMMKVFDHVRPSNVDMTLPTEQTTLTASVDNTERYYEDYIYDDLTDDDIYELYYE